MFDTLKLSTRFNLVCEEKLWDNKFYNTHNSNNTLMTHIERENKNSIITMM